MFERIVVVTKPTALEELLLRRHSKGQAAFFLKSRGLSIEEYEAADATYRAALSVVMSNLQTDVPHETLPRERIASFLFRPRDLIIAVGPDGLCVNVAKYLDGQPILTVNPDPQRIDGVLMRFRPEEVRAVLRTIQRDEAKTDALTLAKATTNDGQTLYAVNDLLIGRRDHISARYSLTHRGKTERQSSSGVLVSTGVGSSGWLRSLIGGAANVMNQPVEDTRYRVPFPWDARYLLFVVREPFPSKYTGVTQIFDTIGRDDTFTITSEMSEGGAIFSDGVIEDAIEFNAGSIVTVSVAEKSARVVARP